MDWSENFDQLEFRINWQPATVIQGRSQMKVTLSFKLAKQSANTSGRGSNLSWGPARDSPWAGSTLRVALPGAANSGGC